MKHLPFAVAMVALIIIAGMLSVCAAELSSGLDIPTPEQIATCRQDAQRLCSPYQGDASVVRACMLAKIPHLSRHCREAIGK